MRLPRDHHERWKPEGFETYSTLAEVCAIVGRDRRRITQLEAAGRIPSPIRVPHGSHHVRLYSPVEVERIRTHFANVKNGRPRRGRRKRAV